MADKVEIQITAEDGASAKIQQVNASLGQTKGAAEGAAGGTNLASKGLGELQGIISRVNPQMGQMVGGLGNAAAGLSSVAGFALVAAPALIAAGKAAYDVGLQYDAAMDKIRIGTGATGRQLESLKGSLNAVAREVPVSLGAAADVIQTLNTRLDITGPALEEMSGQLLNVSRLLEGDATKNAELFSRVIGDWAIPLEDSSMRLDQLYVVSQQTGVGLENLMQKVVQFGVPLRQMGFEFEESIALLGKWEQEGVNTELVLSSLRIAAGNFARENIDLRDGLQQSIAAIKAARTENEALTIAMGVFGARAAMDMAGAIREGRFEYENLLPSLAAAEGAIARTASETDDAAEKMQILKNQANELIEPIGTWLVDGLSNAAQGALNLTNGIRDLNAAIAEAKQEDAAAVESIEEYARLQRERGLISQYTYNQIIRLSEGNQELTFSTDGAATAASRHIREFEELRKKAELMALATSDANQIELQRADAFRATGQAAQDASFALGEQTSEMDALAKAVLDGIAPLSAWYQAQEEGKTYTQLLTEGLREQERAQRELESAQREAYQSTNALIGLAGQAEPTFGNFSQFVRQAGIELLFTGQAGVDAAIALGELTPAQAEQIGLFQQLQQAAQDYKDALTPGEIVEIYQLIQTGNYDAAEAALENAARQQDVIDRVDDTRERTGLLSDEAATSSESIQGSLQDHVIAELETVIDTFDDLRTTAATAMSGVTQSALNSLPALYDVQDVVQGILSRWLQLRNNATINLTANVAGGDGTGRQHGGPVRRGVPYVVGEMRPELFVPYTDGYVLPEVPSARAGGAAAGGGQVMLTINYSPTISLADEREVQTRLAPVVREILHEWEHS